MAHLTVSVWARVYVDVGIADTVRYLNNIPGVRTFASCQGTLGEGGSAPYRAQVMCSWPAEWDTRIRNEFDVTMIGDNFGYVHPRCE